MTLPLGKWRCPDCKSVVKDAPASQHVHRNSIKCKAARADAEAKKNAVVEQGKNAHLNPQSHHHQRRRKSFNDFDMYYTSLSHNIKSSTHEIFGNSSNTSEISAIFHMSPNKSPNVCI